jgi:hypothetical protein
MAQYVYNATTGELFSWTPGDTDPVGDAATLAAAGLALATGLPALGPTVAWNPATKTTETVTAPVAANYIATYDFILLFTPAEHAAIVASTDAKVAQFLMAVGVAQQINLNDPIVQGAVDYLATIGLLTQANATLILSGQPSQ